MNSEFILVHLHSYCCSRQSPNSITAYLHQSPNDIIGMFSLISVCVITSLVSYPQLRTAMRHRPVVLLPTHRSYADFLLVSYLTFHYNLPFPVVAAGMGEPISSIPNIGPL